MKPTEPHGGGHHHSPEELHNDDVAHEESDIDIQRLLVFSGGLAMVVAIVAVLMYGMFWLLERQARQNDPQLSPLAATAVRMPKTTTASPYFGTAGTPQLLTDEPVLLEQVRERERQQLTGYGWVDQTAGVARMPIDEAKKLVLERGLPARTGPAVDQGTGTTAPVRGESSGGRTITAPPADAAPNQKPAPKPVAQPGPH
jgi:hypothetical protein